MRATKLLGSALLIGLLLPVVSQAASIQGPRRTALERLESTDAVRQRLLLRGGRFELAPAIGFTLNDPFQRGVLFGGQLTYHVADSFAIGATVFSSIGFNSDLADRIEEQRPERAKQGTFTELGLLGSLDFTYTPIIGKFALFGRTVLNYDLHVVVGIGGAQQAGSPEVEKFAIAPVVGLGLRTFVSDSVAINIEWRDYLYSAATNAVPNADSGGKAEATEESFSNHFALTIGVGFFFPSKPERTK